MFHVLRSARRVLAIVVVASSFIVPYVARAHDVPRSVYVAIVTCDTSRDASSSYDVDDARAIDDALRAFVNRYDCRGTIDVHVTYIP